ncbi:hypothetical protein GH714_009542 [Hevea brasiliensis]|uniref:Uncharacterized protein n=1 Tax=Hevea brasiliensis TaxID=3981 RepID=A0A6A6L3W4_HEVBR|nr:hypothetical protein GH714_009542 [Hevea brasiliensis]
MDQGVAERDRETAHEDGMNAEVVGHFGMDVSKRKKKEGKNIKMVENGTRVRKAINSGLKGKFHGKGKIGVKASSRFLVLYDKVVEEVVNDFTGGEDSRCEWALNDPSMAMAKKEKPILKRIAGDNKPSVERDKEVELPWPSHGIHSTLSNGAQGPDPSFQDPTATNGRDDPLDARLPIGGGLVQSISTELEFVNGKEPRSLNDGENGVTSRDSTLVASSNEVEVEY